MQCPIHGGQVDFAWRGLLAPLQGRGNFVQRSTTAAIPSQSIVGARDLEPS